MNNINEVMENTTVKVRDLLIYLGITAAVSAVAKKISRNKDLNVFIHAFGLTLGWLVGKLITNYIDGNSGDQR